MYCAHPLHVEFLDKTNHETNNEVCTKKKKKKKSLDKMQKKSVNWLCKENGQFTSRQLERKLDFFKNRLGLGHFIETCIKKF